MMPAVIYLAVLALIAYMAALYASEALLMAAVAGLVLFAAIYLYLAVLLLTVRVKVTLPISMVEWKNEAELRVRLENRWLFYANKVRVCFYGINELTGKKYAFHGEWSAEAARSKICYRQVRGAHCGSILYTVKSLRVYDMTGFFWLGKKCRQHARLLVMPPIYETTVTVTEQSRHFLGETEVYDVKMPGPDASEIFAVRPFRDGDRLQNIHWKLSAKTEELMVRENSLPLGCPVVILLDLEGRNIRYSQKQMDDFLTVISSLSCGLVEQKCAHHIAWYSSRRKDIVRMRVDKEEDVYGVLTVLLAEQMPAAGVSMPDVREQYREKYRAETAVTVLTMNLRSEIYNGDTLYAIIAERSVEQGLREVEFIV
ncbi:MAG: DUF58 domain-containing protein [Roseburia sp.]|nr:DUF58 domain-containing protein [Roseburia sp.]